MEQSNNACDFASNSVNQEQLTPVELFTKTASNFNLPEYIQNMLVACGYDRLETIAKMNVDESEPGKLSDIDRMLNYLKQNYPNDSRLV